MLEYKTSVHFLHSPHPWDNELMMKRKPTYYHGWFTAEELCKMNPAFESKDFSSFHFNPPVQVNLFHPHNNYYVLIHDARNRG